jgi:multidrug efflux pump subunit AcrA (membrane-fusion protein)
VPSEVIAALIVEQIEDSTAAQSLTTRVNVVANHSAAAISNAMEHQSLFLLPLWKTLGKLRPVVGMRALPRNLAIAASLIAMVVALAVVPADFELEAKGTLQPTLRRDVFAGIDGVVVEVEVQHGKTVQEGDPVAQLRNTDLEVQITDLVGRREATTGQMHSLERAMLGETRLGIDEQNRISGQLLQLRKTYESLGRQLELYRKKQEQLRVTSPISGQIVTWQVDQQLMRRPVRQGQVLMSVADPSGPWELEIHMPEDRMGHIAQAASASNKPLAVNYILATDPGTSHVGTVTEIHTTAQVRGDEGSTVLLRVAIDKSKLKDLRPGSSVSAKVDCGNRSVGYVWLHDLIAFVQSRILFRM